MSTAKFIALDYGAGSGRALIGKISDKVIGLEELHRFENPQIKVHGHIYWDLLYLFRELKRVKYNIACYYSFKGETNNASKYLRNSCKIDSKYEREWVNDDHFENLRKTGFQL